jgi:alpha-galactosidase
MLFVHHLLYRTRGFVAMCGTFGYELDLTKECVADLLLFKEQIACYKSIAHIVRRGDLYRLWDPFKVCYT